MFRFLPLKKARATHATLARLTAARRFPFQQGKRMLLRHLASQAYHPAAFCGTVRF
jgi:hypothetical protein